MKQPKATVPPETLDGLNVGDIGRITYIDRESPMYGRMEDIGIHTGAYIRCERVSLFGDPVAYRILRKVESIPFRYDRSTAENTAGSVGAAEGEGSTTSEQPITFAEEMLIALRRSDARAVHIEPWLLKETEPKREPPLVAMAGNPNVGKSSLFNAMTGMRRHTGNWTGKTVDCAVGDCRRRRGIWGPRRQGSTVPSVRLADLPGSYSLDPHSPEEDETLQFLLREPVRAVVVVCEPASLGRNLLIAYQIANLPRHIPIILCVNLIDEADRHGICVDADALSAATGFPVVMTSAKTGCGLDDLSALLCKIASDSSPEAPKEPSEAQITDPVLQENTSATSPVIPPATDFIAAAEEAVRRSVIYDTPVTARRARAEKRLEHLLTSRVTAIPLAILLLALVFWLTIEGSNRPSAWLSAGFARLGELLMSLHIWNRLPSWFGGLLLDGVYATLTRVVAVMLPPMAIFFPLFTLMEDFGLLPRIAFNFDRCFQSCRACGKQALTMCMGFGCNAAGVTGCRIIDTPRERMVAVLTNSLVPCNGKFPTLIAMASLLTVQADGTAGKHGSFIAALCATGLVVLAVLITLPISRLLSATVLRGQANGFVMEMPPFRTPHIGRVLVRALLDRTLFVLGRAVAVAAPAGAVLWLLTNMTVSGKALLIHLTTVLDPIGAWLCVDGAILAALLLAAPANELTLPILLMIYTSASGLTDYTSTVALGTQLSSASWSGLTAVAFTILFLFHAPCTTTLLTVRKETGKWRWVLLAAAIPTAVGLLLCGILRLGWMVLG